MMRGQHAEPGRDALRFKVCNEILETERAYCKYLDQMSKFYLQPLANEKLIEKGPVEKLFREVEEIQNINKLILAELEKRMANWSSLPRNEQRIGDIFAQLSPFLKLYSEYVSDYHTNFEYLNRQLEKKSVAKFLEKCSAQVPPEYDQKQSLLSLLIMPIQRIPRYQLLLTELLKNTDTSHPDYSEIAKALERVKEVATRVDSMVKERQNLERLIQISKSVTRGYSKGTIPATLVSLGRTFIFEGPLVKACRKDNQERYFFLFSDALLYCKTLPTLSEAKYEGRGLLYLNGATVTDLPDKDGMCNRFAIQTTKKSFVVSARTPEQKKQWMELLQKVISDLAATTADLKNRIKKDVSGNRTDTQQGEDDSSEEEMRAAAVWIQDKDAPDCMICGKHFTTFFRRHHCRNCGDVVCDNCSKKRMILKHISTEKKLRVCLTCFEKLSQEELNKQKARTIEKMNFLSNSSNKVQTTSQPALSPLRDPSRPNSCPVIQKNRIESPQENLSFLMGNPNQTSPGPQSQSGALAQSTLNLPSPGDKKISSAVSERNLRASNENKPPRGRSTPTPLPCQNFTIESQPKTDRTLSPPLAKTSPQELTSVPNIRITPTTSKSNTPNKPLTNSSLGTSSPQISVSSPKKGVSKPLPTPAKGHQKALSLNSAFSKISPKSNLAKEPLSSGGIKTSPPPPPPRTVEIKVNMNGTHLNNNNNNSNNNKNNTSFPQMNTKPSPPKRTLQRPQ